MTETAAGAVLNRGKRRVTLDLKDPADAAIAARFAASAGVVIENFRPGVMDRHGLGWQQLAPVAPRLIYCSLPGFGRDDPRAAIPAWEDVAAAATANCSIRVGQEPEGKAGSAETAQRQRERHVRVRRWPVHPDGPDRQQRPVPPLATGRRGCGVLGGGRPDRRSAPGPA